MSQRQSDPPKETPECPRCQGTEVIETFERFGERLFFCPACEHSWAMRPRDAAPADE